MKTELTERLQRLKEDLQIQSVLLILSLAFLFLNGAGLIFFYFMLGPFQVISAIRQQKYKPVSKARQFYWWQLVFHAFCFISVFVFMEARILVYILFSTFISAIYYYNLSIDEYRLVKKMCLEHNNIIIF